MKLLTFDWSDQNELAASDTLEFSLAIEKVLGANGELMNDYMTRHNFLYTFLNFNPSINTLKVVCFLFS